MWDRHIVLKSSQLFHKQFGFLSGTHLLHNRYQGYCIFEHAKFEPVCNSQFRSNSTCKTEVKLIYMYTMREKKNLGKLKKKLY